MDAGNYYRGVQSVKTPAAVGDEPLHNCDHRPPAAHQVNSSHLVHQSLGIGILTLVGGFPFWMYILTKDPYILPQTVPWKMHQFDIFRLVILQYREE